MKERKKEKKNERSVREGDELEKEKRRKKNGRSVREGDEPEKEERNKERKKKERKKKWKICEGGGRTGEGRKK
jgi:hypothetical protein